MTMMLLATFTPSEARVALRKGRRKDGKKDGRKDGRVT
jgi:hypothetical protein